MKYKYGLLALIFLSVAGGIYPHTAISTVPDQKVLFKCQIGVMKSKEMVIAPVERSKAKATFQWISTELKLTGARTFYGPCSADLQAFFGSTLYVRKMPPMFYPVTLSQSKRPASEWQRPVFTGEEPLSRRFDVDAPRPKKIAGDFIGAAILSPGYSYVGIWNGGNLSRLYAYNVVNGHTTGTPKLLLVSKYPIHSVTALSHHGTRLNVLQRRSNGKFIGIDFDWAQ